MKVKYHYSGKQFCLEPYTTAQEKDLLLLSAVGDIDIDIALDVCNVEESVIIALTEPEKVSMLFKLREISVGSEINVQFKCSECNASNENTINIENIITSSCINSSCIIDAFEPLTEKNINKFVGDVDEMDLDVYQLLVDEVKNSVTKFNFKRKTQCQKCTCDNYIDISSSNFVVDICSEDSLVSLYQTYNDLVLFGNYSKLDIDSMYPFERTIFIGLLNKSKEGQQ